ncbi:GNAT family N-acetyltransferase [Acaryochloris marina NIES-2412]|uniref:GNAT family N-acetyltransferase n=1 Tax=Acaryochloris marina TaxID=155978 RepID=UPI004058F08E
MIKIIELTDSKKDSKTLENFYQEIFVKEFNNPNERESLKNMMNYLKLKSQGWYEKNNYHILVATNETKVIAGLIADYLALTNSGVIEFIVVSKNFRLQGIGSTILKKAQEILFEDAIRNNNFKLDFIIGEIEDPYKLTSPAQDVDPISRSEIWHKWGFRGVDFPYIQPALSKSQKSLTDLLLIVKIFRQEWLNPFPIIPSKIVKLFVREYLYWAMRIDKPENCNEYCKMSDFLDKRKEIASLSLLRYIGHDPDKSINVHELHNDNDDFAAAITIYKQAFQNSPYFIPAKDFLTALSISSTVCKYHLWALSTEKTGTIQGIASFFTFPDAGFGGYVALTNIKKIKLLYSLLIKIELKFLTDFENSYPSGWYIETDLNRNPSLLKRLGFWEIDIKYEQPPVHKNLHHIPARLYYKPIGRNYEMPILKKVDFLKSFTKIFNFVYGIKEPEIHDSYIRLKSQINYNKNKYVMFR